jgi:hypothetical protein
MKPDLKAALALAAATLPFQYEAAYNNLEPFRRPVESCGEAAARILAAEVRKIQADSARLDWVLKECDCLHLSSDKAMQDRDDIDAAMKGKL